MDDLPIWTYWDGPLTDVIRLCLDRMRRLHPDIQILKASSFRRIFEDDAVSELDILSEPNPMVRTDMVRNYLLRFHGGIWIDADTIVRDVLPGLGGIRTMMSEGGFDYIGVRTARSINNHMMAAPKGSWIAADIWNRTVRLHKGQDSRNLRVPSHCRFGRGVLEPALRSAGTKYHLFDPSSTQLHGGRTDSWKIYFEPPSSPIPSVNFMVHVGHPTINHARAQGIPQGSLLDLLLRKGF